MAGIQDIGNGLGLLYVTATDGTTIMGTQPNNAQGVRQMRNIGAACAPISTDRPAIGTVTFTAVGGAGNITGITIGGVNQIGGNVAGTVGDLTATADAVANAINGFTPGSGPDFTAQAIAGVLYIFSTPATGVSVNGSTITVAVSNVAITTTTTPFTNGADGSGAYDSNVGLRFFINANYTGTVTPVDVTGALEITEYIVVRGMQSGVPRQSVTISGDRILTLPRYGCIQEVVVGTQGGASTDYLAFINTSAFSVGDQIRLIAPDLSEVTTVIDMSDNSSPLLQKNIKLVDATPFALQNYQGITLVLTYELAGGLIWTEDTRAFSGGRETISRAVLLSRVNTSTLVPGKEFYVNDVGQNGIIIKAATVNRLELSCQYLALVPDFQNTGTNFGGTWGPLMPVPTPGRYYSYNQYMYESVTGGIGSAPDTDTANWALVSYSTGEYISEIHYAEYDIVNDWFSYRADKRGNTVRQVYGNTYTRRPDLCMAWGNDNFTGNTVVDASCQLQNYLGACKNNNLENRAELYNFFSTTDGVFSGNSISGPVSIYDMYIDRFDLNSIVVGNISSISNFGSAGTSASNQWSGNVLKSTVAFSGDNTGTSIMLLNTWEAGYGVYTFSGDHQLSTNSFYADGISSSYLIGAVSGSIAIGNCVFNQTVSVELVSLSGDNTFEYCSFTRGFSSRLSGNCTISKVAFSDQALGTDTDPNTRNHTFVISDTINLDSALSGGTLTMPEKYGTSGGNFNFQSSNPTETISKILGLYLSYPSQLMFYCESGLTVTFDGTTIGSVVNGSIVSDAATDVIVGNSDTALCDRFYCSVESNSLATLYYVRKQQLNKLI